MTTRASFFKGGLKLVIGQVVGQASSFAKSLIVARLISPANYGIAAIFQTTYTFLEMISNLSAQMLLVQAEDGDDPRFQKTAQFIQVGRGLTNAIIIFLLAGPICRLFGAPQAKFWFQCLALAPLIRGFNHLDLNRLQRKMKFGPFVVVDAGSSVLVAFLALPLAFWLRDYRAMLWLEVAQSMGYLVGSHLVAERRYGWAWDRHYSKRIFHFGWPLLINGLILYGIFHGDQLVIGSARRLFRRGTYTLADLGIYYIGFSLAQAPTLIVSNICSSLFLPLLSSAKGTWSKFKRRYLACIQIVSLVGAVVAIGFIVAGGSFVILVYGQQYAEAGIFVGWLAAMQALRILRVAPTLAAMAYADTRNAMVSNIARSSALVGVLLAAASGRGLIWIAVSGFLGELLALAVCVCRLQLRHAVPAILCLRPFAVFAGGVAVSLLVVVCGIRKLGLAPTFTVAAGLVIFQVLGTIYLFSGVRDELNYLVVKLRSFMAEDKLAT